MKKKLISILLTLTITMSLFAAFTVSASAATGGNCGNNGANNRNGNSIQWALVDGGKTLEFTGKGTMEAFAFWATDSGRYVPWWDNRESITKVVVKDGVKNIGQNALRGLPNLEILEVGSSVRSIDYCGVYNCQNLKKVIIQEGLVYIREYAFAYDYALEEIVLPSTLRMIEAEAFYETNNIKNFWFCGPKWSRVMVLKSNETIDTFVSHNAIKCQDQILDFSKWITDGFSHWHESKSDFPVHVVGPKTAHYDNNGDGICDDCGTGILDTSKTLTYIDENGSQQTVASDIRYLSGKETEITDGWYAVGTNIDFGNTRLKINGDVKIILKDYCGIIANKGIELTEGNTLTVTSSSSSGKEKVGRIVSNVTGCETAIGSASHDYMIDSGWLQTGPNEGHWIYGEDAEHAGTMNVYGGRIMLSSERGAAFGGGRGSDLNLSDRDSAGNGGNGGWLNVYGGWFTASSGWHAIYGGSKGDGAYQNMPYGWKTGTKTVVTCGNGVTIRAGSDSDNTTVITADQLDTEAFVEFSAGNASGFTLSEGNWWIIAVGAAVILGGIAAILVVNKKKKTAA